MLATRRPLLWTRLRYNSFYLFCLTLALAATAVGCNLFGRLDPPSATQDIYTAAIAAGNDGRCQDAVNLLVSIQTPTDDSSAALGWAYLCLASAPAASIAKSLYSYSANAANYKVIGALANALLPTSSAQQNFINQAIGAFSLISDPVRRGLNLGIGQFVTAAWILGNQATLNNHSPLAATDIAPAACSTVASTCATAASGPCTPAGSAPMQNGSVDAFVTALSSASTDLQSTNASDLQNLAGALSSSLPVGQEDQARCFIFNNMIP